MKRYVICVNNYGNKASLILRKTYEISEKPSTVKGRIRIIDEDGDEALYLEKNFVIIQDISINKQIEKNLFKLAVWNLPMIIIESFGKYYRKSLWNL